MPPPQPMLRVAVIINDAIRAIAHEPGPDPVEQTICRIWSLAAALPFLAGFARWRADQQQSMLRACERDVEDSHFFVEYALVLAMPRHPIRDGFILAAR